MIDDERTARIERLNKLLGCPRCKPHRGSNWRRRARPDSYKDHRSTTGRIK